MNKYIQLLRIKHYIKNILLFVPMICAKNISSQNVVSIILAFISFSFISSVVYIVNDIKDIDNDKMHPTKKNRPLPSGKIKKSTAIVIAIVLFIAAQVINFIICKSILDLSYCLLLSYFIINLLYSMGLKNIAIIDIALLASGFVLRVYYGAAVTNIEVSNWLFLTVLTGSLFLGLGKRKKELLISDNVRKVLKEYNESFLDKFQYVALSLMLIFYSLWTIEQGNNYLVYTVPLLIIIFMKYSLIIEKTDEGDPTTVLYQDKPLLALCTIYGILMILFLVIL